VFDSDDSSLINDLPVQDAIAIEESENEGWYCARFKWFLAGG
jgi:hypothetical protein